MHTDLTFAHGYIVELIHDLPGVAVPNRIFIPPSVASTKDGIFLRVAPQSGEPWIGTFAFGHFGVDFSAVIASPEPGTLFVVSSGAGYIVNTEQPFEWGQLHCLPIRDARVALNEELVVFADFTHMCAYGRRGLAWQSRRLCWDGLEIISMDASKIVGCGDDPTNSNKPKGHFELDLLTGQVTATDFVGAYEQSLW